MYIRLQSRIFRCFDWFEETFTNVKIDLEINDFSNIMTKNRMFGNQPKHLEVLGMRGRIDGLKQYYGGYGIEFP